MLDSSKIVFFNPKHEMGAYARSFDFSYDPILDRLTVKTVQTIKY